MGVDTDAFRRSNAYEPVRPGETLRLFSCGRLNPIKGHGDLLQAVRLLLDQGQPTSLVIAGEDEEGGTGFRRVIEARVTELGLTAHVRLLGAVDEGRVRDELLMAHVFALASHDEGVPVALMEAMACGVPTIGTTVGGVGELVLDGINGELVPPRDPPRLAAVILGLASDPERALRLAAAGRLRVEAAFDASRGAETLMRELGLPLA